MTSTHIKFTFTIAILASLATASAKAQLTHRWSFNENGGAGTALADSVGGSNGTIVDLGALDADVGQTFPGQVYMTGGDKNTSDYISLGDNLVSTYTDMTLEFWATRRGNPLNWSRVFSLGDGTNNVMHTSWSRGTNGNQNEFRWNAAAGNLTLQDWGTGGTPGPGGWTQDQEYHFAVVVDDDGGGTGNTNVSLYVDGAVVASGDTNNDPSTLVNPHFWLGRSQWGDASANASWNEVRVYSSALSSDDIASNIAMGPDTIIPEPSTAVLSLIALSGLLGLAFRRRRA